MTTFSDWLPHVNAALNGLSTVFLTIGYLLIRSGRRRGHRIAMTAALVTSGAFLVSYLVYHFTAPVFVFPGQGWVRPLYFALLISHVILATAVTPLAILTAVRAFRGYGRDRSLNDSAAFAGHKSIARWALPVWLYVTVTGIVVYAILFHVYGSPTATPSS